MTKEKLEPAFKKHSSSFRDPCGFIFFCNGVLYRQINQNYKHQYNNFIKSGLYQALTDKKLIVPHEEVSLNEVGSEIAYKIIKPSVIPFISYPYEWSFSQLKDAALTTLQIQKLALNYGMILKDASAYNIQFLSGRPTFIDTLSFEFRKKNEPWVAYRQFCQHFFAPLALLSHRDVRLGQLLRNFIDGIPLDLASSLLPPRSRLSFSILTHIHLHAKSQKHFANKKNMPSSQSFSKQKHLALIDSLESAIRKLKIKNTKTEWGNYYAATNYTDKTFKQKKEIVLDFLKIIKPKTVWDLGANTGLFSRLACDQGIFTVSFDIDPLAVEKNYLEAKQKKETKILPLLLDLTNPSPALGWAHQERMSLYERGPAGTVMALALIHHLAISNNLPFAKIAEFLSVLGKYLIIEFVPKEDSNAGRLLATREDIFPDYDKTTFENEFKKYFAIKKTVNLEYSKRNLYLMESLD